MKKGLLLLLLIFYVSCAFSSNDQRSILQNIQNGIEKLMVENSTVPHFLNNAVKSISKIPKKESVHETNCKSCEIVVNSTIIFRRSGADRKAMGSYLEKLCNVFSGWGPVACKGYTEIELGTILYIIDYKRNLTPKRVCAIYLQADKCVDPDANKWIIPLPPKIDDEARNDAENKVEKADPLKILQLTDIHYDPLYQPGSDAVCNEQLCCQGGTPSKPENAAGYWGDYNVCDMPLHSVENLLHRIKEKHLKDIDFIYYTGDIISHKSWATSKEENTNTLREIYGLFSKTFGNTLVYPILGNHEPHPTDFFSSDGITQDQLSTQWVFNVSAEEWSRWLPEEAMSTLRKGGYYTVLVKPGFRIVALNSNVCYTSNLWLFYDDEDPYEQLVWLVEVLSEAEKRGEKVHILSHIPPGEILCQKQWSNQFHKIINRFASTISAQFNGHTHIDELKVFYHPNDTNRVINVAFNGGSFTTFVGYNPNYRIYHVDPTDATVENYDQYIFNLTEANESGSTAAPDWYKLYSFKEAYGLGDLSNDSFDELLKKMHIDHDLMYQYYRFLVRDSDVKIKDGCGTKCLEKLLCLITCVETDLALEC